MKNPSPKISILKIRGSRARFEYTKVFRNSTFLVEDAAAVKRNCSAMGMKLYEPERKLRSIHWYHSYDEYFVLTARIGNNYQQYIVTKSVEIRDFNWLQKQLWDESKGIMECVFIINKLHQGRTASPKSGSN